jgi:hypothetical protein
MAPLLAAFVVWLIATGRFDDWFNLAMEKNPEVLNQLSKPPESDQQAQTGGDVSGENAGYSPNIGVYRQSGFPDYSNPSGVQGGSYFDNLDSGTPIQGGTYLDAMMQGEAWPD